MINSSRRRRVIPGLPDRGRCGMSRTQLRGLDVRPPKPSLSARLVRVGPLINLADDLDHPEP
jgi:hypothetical protein